MNQRNRILAAAILFALAVCLMVGLAFHEECVIMPAVFDVWEKQTGNPSDLSYSEWRLLRKLPGSISEPLATR